MKYLIIIEDTPKGIRALAQDSLNGCLDNPEISVASKVVANFSLFLQKQTKEKLLLITNETQDH